MGNFNQRPIDLPSRQVAIRAQCFHPSGSFIEFSEADVESSIPERFQKLVRLHPERIAVKTGRHEMTYAELNAAANRIAGRIMEKAGANTVPIATLLENGPDLAASMLGILKAGRCFVLVDPTFPKARISAILGDSQANLLIHSNYHSSLANETKGLCDSLELESIEDSEPAEDLRLPYSPNDIAVLFYTSGSTGYPKGVIQSHRSLLHYMRVRANCFHACPEDRVSLLSSGTSNVVSNSFTALLAGSSLLPFDLQNNDVLRLKDWLLKEKISICLISPQVFRALCDSFKEKPSFPDLRILRLTSDAARKSDLELFKLYFARSCILVSGLSSSETGVMRKLMMTHDSEVSTNELPVGYPLDDIEIVLLDDEGREVGFNQVGEIVVKSRYLSSGYWNNRALTEAKFQRDPNDPEMRIYYTGDLGLMLADGCLIHKGRKDMRVKIRGYGVDLLEVEQAVLSHPGIKKAVAVAKADQNGLPRLVAYVVPRVQQFPSIRDLRQHIRKALPDYMIPSVFVKVDEIPLTSNGKVDHRALPEPDSSRPKLHTNFVAPRSEEERRIVKIWSEVLGLTKVGVSDNFFDLGGHSLAAARVVTRVFQEFRLQIPLQYLFESPTVSEMAGIIVKHRNQFLNATELESILQELESVSEKETQGLLSKTARGHEGNLQVRCKSKM